MEIQELSAAASASDPFLFVASTGNKNRKGLILQQDGWILSGFKANPIALWMHNHEMPIGTWSQVKVEAGELMAKLTLAARGTSAFIDTLWNLVEQKIVRAASVGFKPTDYDIQKDGSILIKKMELREISLVTVPGDADALRVLSAMPEDVRDRFVLGHERKPGKTADPPKKRSTVMPTLAEKIRAKDEELSGTKDKISVLAAKDDLSDEETVQLEELAGSAETLEKALGTLRKAEAALALGARTAKPGSDKTPATVKKSRDKAELLFRAAYVIAKGHVSNRSLGEIVLNDFGGDKELEMMTLAASTPAMTGVAGWAAELIETQIGEFLDLLTPESVWARIAGLRVVFDRFGAIRLPGRTVRGLGGNFIGEGAPIPVKQTVLSSVLLSPFKLGVITTMTRELALRSSPAAEPLFRAMMIEDTAVTIDQLFMDATAASAVRPAGLQVLGTGAAMTGTGTVDNIITDLKTMVTNMINAGAGRRPVWVMNETTRIGLTLKPSTTADSFPFKAEVLAGNLLGYPIITSITVPTGLVFLIDQAEMAQGYGESPAIEMSNQATLHMEDTTPLPIATTGVPNVVAAPTRSLFQTDSLALRLIWDITWALRRSGAVQFRTGVTW